MESFAIDKLANSGIPVDIGGKTYFVTQITLRDQGKLQSVLRKIQPLPLEQVKSIAPSLPADVAAQVIKDARKEQSLFYPVPLTSTEGLSLLLGNEEGQKALLQAGLGKQQKLSEDDINNMLDVITYPQFMRVAGIAISGEDPDADPKS